MFSSPRLILFSQSCGSPFDDDQSIAPVACTPLADFEASHEGCKEDCEVVFSNLSEKSTSYSWDFGDGRTSEEENPTHIYDIPGQYEVSLVAKCGLETSEKSKTVSIIQDLNAGWICGQPYFDSRDGKSYKTVWVDEEGGNDKGKIGNCWLAENLNFDSGINTSVCFDNLSANCEKFGRLYEENVVANVLPTGWRLPKKADWTQLLRHFGLEERPSPSGVTFIGNLDFFLTGGRTGMNVEHTGVYWSNTFPPQEPVFEFAELERSAFYWIHNEEEKQTYIQLFSNFEVWIANEADENEKYSIRAIKE